MITHHISTACNIATGVITHVLQTESWTSKSCVVTCLAGYLKAKAHLG
jgi:hypothetical protein